MSDHEFEKKVKQQLDELKFRPAEAVWEGVEKKIRGDKRRRRALLWLPLLFLGLTAGGFWYYSGTTGETPSTLAKTSAPGQPANITKENNKPATPGSNNSTAGDAQSMPPAEEKNTPPPVEKTTPVTTVNDKNITTKKETKPPAAKEIISARKKTVTQNIEQQQLPVTVKKKLEDDTSTGNAKEENAAQQGREVAVQQTDKEISNNLPPVNVATEPATTNKIAEEPAPTLLKPVSVLPTIRSLYDINTQLAVDSVSDQNGYFKPAPLIAGLHKSRWQWGLEMNGGFSNISTAGFFNLPALLGAEKNFSEDLSYNSPSTGGPLINGSFNISINPPLNEASVIRNGYAYSAGAFIQRTFTKRFALSAGLHYSYFSVQTRVGQLVDNQRAVNIGTSNSRLVENYYGGRITQNYTSRFYLVELPLTTHTQLNRSERLPIVLDAGVAVSRLMSTNALHYDGVQGIYFKDDNLFNKMQLGMNAGLSVGLFQYSRNPIYVGPVLHYSFSRLVKKEVSDGQFLWSTGINVKMLLKK